MALRKYKRVMPRSVSTEEPHAVCTEDAATQDSFDVAQIHPSTSTRGLEAQSTPTAHGLCGEPPHATERAPPPSYKKGDIITIDENGLRQQISMPSPRDIWGLREGLRVVIQMNNDGQAVGVGSEKLSRFGSLLIKTGNLCPMSYPDWRTAPEEVTEPLWEIMRKKFYFETSLPPEKVKKFILQGLGKRRREHKYELKHSLNLQLGETPESLIETVDPDYIVDPADFEVTARHWCDPKVQAKAKKNKASRGKQALLHTSGSKSFARSAFEEKSISGRGPNRSQLFIKTHKHKDGTPVSTVAASKIAQLEELMSQQPPSSRGSTQGTILWDPNDPYSKVLGKERPGRVRGLGFGCRPSSSTLTSRMPYGTCNDPQHAQFDEFRKYVDKEFQRLFAKFDEAFALQRGESNVNFDSTFVCQGGFAQANENDEDDNEDEAND